ncbi:biphenyl dioxygenase subunit beta [Burkholderia cenocepacia]|uniref:Biphenyl dioxygenase subunit beta n=1 Tax=Burkholderia cenocepacia TaxID=95486 RepID=A0AAN0VMB4_9BURK|nr:biphenyl dioxygenase subunit beta [Burkholderia cenocepacia]
MKDMNIIERMQLQFRVEQFYFAEAATLDEWRYDDWVELFTDDTRYWMPVRRTRTTSEMSQEFSELGSVAYFDDTREILLARVRKLRTGLAWAEDPPSRTRRFIANVLILDDDGSELTVTSNFQVYRTRLDSEEDSWIGRREDVLRRTGDGFRIASRKIYLEQTVLLARNLSNFF